MCGIAGLVNFQPSSPDRDLLGRMTEMLSHRGPDDCGVYVDRNVGLAHTRLSIIDVAGGRQPMQNKDHTLSITFNGEIFNYIELREELQRKGHRFETSSDTEVLLHLYEEEGEDCTRHLNGQWAFAIWDRAEKKLFLSRDRLGVRPLFYTVTDEAFIFGSEVKALFAHPRVDRELDLIALDQIFTFWFTLPPRTIFKGISELPPAHSMTVKGGQVRTFRYWQFDYPRRSLTSANPRKSECEYAEELRDLLLDATRIRLRSDVPVGAYLSGGLDSTVITALVRKLTNGRLRTFSVTFDDPEFDESSHQNDAVHFLQTEHQEVHCSVDEIGRLLPDVIWHTEKPILRTAPVPLFLLSRLVREAEYKVVLTGEGSDEILGGYDIFKEAKIRRFCAARPDSRIRPRLLKRLYPYLQSLHSQPEGYLQAFFRARPEDLSNPFFSHLPRWELTSKLKVFLSGALKAQLLNTNPYGQLTSMLPPGHCGWDSFCQGQYLEAAYLLPGYILSSQGDRVAMAHSVEGRFPFLDHRVVDFAAQLPPQLKMKVLNEKYLLKQCAQDLIPASVRNRPKQPYRAPDAKSFFDSRTGRPRHTYVGELLSADRIRRDGIFDPVAVGKLVEKAKRGHTIGIRDNMAVVGILTTQLVLDQFMLNFDRKLNHANHRAGIAPICN